MIPERIEDSKNRITRSRKGNIFKYSSPIPGLHIYDNVWPESVDFFKKIEDPEYWKDSETTGNVPWVREDYLNEDTGKKSTSCWIGSDNDIRAGLEEVIDSYLYHWNLDPRSRESMRITKFTGPGEFFGSHSDDSFATPRTVSMVYYPDDDYEGGELEFIHFGIKIKPKAGQLFIFPSGYSYEHKVYAVLKGTRTTMVSFFNEITTEERTIRMSYIDPNQYYQPKVQYVFDETFGSMDKKYPQ